MQRLILQSYQSPGDIVMLTAAVRDLHRAYPDRFQTDVRTSADALFENNPWITKLSERERGVQTLTMHYPLIHESNQRPYHFLHGYVQFLEQQLDLKIPLTEFQGDIHLSADEKESPRNIGGVALPERYWIMVAGGKYDFTAKWWNPASYQAVVDHFQDRLQFVQCGEQGHWHPPLQGVTSLIGRTSLREFVRLMYFADGVVCPVTLAMHLAAAVECSEDRPPRRPCVVIYGDTVQIHERDSVGFLQEFGRPIDVLYLDSLDTTEPGHAEHALREAKSALPLLHERSLLLIDDTYWREGAFCGKGAHAVPWLVQHGWQILYAGYQVLLTRRET